MFNPKNPDHWAIKQEITTHKPVKACESLEHNGEPHYVLSCELVALHETGEREYRVVLASHPIKQIGQAWRH